MGSEVLVAGLFSYAARESAFHLLGLSVPASAGKPMLADLDARRLSGVMDEFAAEFCPAGLERLESALLQVVGTSAMERAALGMLVS
ncbi:hypothetical protein [Longimicrobium sp.]|uniref:hypothetical protein n=1 Tax=Longimicrobium sp. TaxID=2029185 RepID=UPI002EDAF00A